MNTCMPIYNPLSGKIILHFFTVVFKKNFYLYEEIMIKKPRTHALWGCEFFIIVTWDRVTQVLFTFYESFDFNVFGSFYFCALYSSVASGFSHRFPVILLYVEICSSNLSQMSAACSNSCLFQSPIHLSPFLAPTYFQSPAGPLIPPLHLSNAYLL